MKANRLKAENLPENPPWLSIKETAQLFGVHSNTVREWIAGGSLPAYRLGTRLVRINPADVLKLAEPYSPIDRQVWGS